MTGTIKALLSLGEQGHHPASAVICVRDGEREMSEAGGWAVLPSRGKCGRPMGSDCLVDCASVTKMASTTILSMILVHAGQLDLRQTVHHYLRGFGTGGKDSITVFQLLTHTAGLIPWTPLYCRTRNRDKVLSIIDSLPLDSTPGTTWRYSDLGYIIAGLVIEKILGCTIGKAFKDLVSGPLKLQAGYGPKLTKTQIASTAISGDSDLVEYTMIRDKTPYSVPFSADSFRHWRKRCEQGEVNDCNAYHALGEQSGHAGLFATPGSLTTLMWALQNDVLVPHSILDEFSRPCSINPEQAIGFRRMIPEGCDGSESILYHPGFTGTWLGFQTNGSHSIFGAAMRLYGTIGTIDDSTEWGNCIAASKDINGIMVDRLVSSIKENQ